MIAVRDVRASVDWYCRLLACRCDRVSEEFDRIRDEDRILLLVHSRAAQEHAAWPAVAEGRVGDGFLLWILVEDFDGVYRRARESTVEILLEPHVNPEDRAREFTLRDPDGYCVAIAECPD
jgi:catechol 2,3-dioxygenase-like lactoylglutathione lyase family enzyme